ncbi:hypothetical protein AB0I95_10825 [Micromonospora sp. NPDC049751]|uniref:hypothetical protein n=1 Tax=Micromonospora sp. NPDC049751 TaxID=3154837 RepID=UPI0033D65FD1
MTPHPALTNTTTDRPIQRDCATTAGDDSELRSHRRANGEQHADTVIVDALTAFLNRDPEPSAADALQLMSTLIDSSGRPLLAETWDFTTEVSEDRYGIPTATLTAGPVTIAVTQLPGAAAPLRIAITTDNGEHVSLDLTVNQHPVHDPAVLSPSPAPADSPGPNLTHNHLRRIR